MLDFIDRENKLSVKVKKASRMAAHLLSVRIHSNALTC
jgi:hypothetical protein